MGVKVSIILTTYNWPEALGAVLSALEDQTYPHFEVIVADDGSGSATRDLIQSFQQRGRLDLKQVWQEDAGFQAAKIRNKAVAIASGAYLIFLDGDSIPQPRFIQRHMSLAKPGWFVVGRRVLLNPELTQQVLKNKTPIHQWSQKRFLHALFQRHLNRICSLWNLPLGPLRRLHANTWQGAMTCNLGVWRKDFLAVNGLDESFVGWGYEDSDFVVRLLRSGVRRISAKYKAPVIHLWHPANNRAALKENFEKFYVTYQAYTIRAQQGVSQYVQEAPACKTPLSVAIITFNEANKLRACLESVQWACEIIIVDSGSTDKTLQIAQEYTDKIYQTDWPGFGIQKNRAIAYATQDWILVLDADEVLSQGLQAEIKTLLAHPTPEIAAYQIHRQSLFMGKLIHHGDWSRDWVTRLFRSGQAAFDDAPVHEALVIQGKTARLQHPMKHYAIDRLEQSLSKLNQYSTLSAHKYVERGKNTCILGAWARSQWTFLRGYLLRLGVLDGLAGYLIAKLNAEGTFYKYSKAQCLQKNHHSKQKMRIKELSQQEPAS